MGPEIIHNAATLDGLFRARLRQTPDAVAYLHFEPADQQWHETSWRSMSVEIGRWQAALRREGLKAGERVALMMGNSREWIVCEQAALGLGLVVVPLYVDDRPENVAYILDQTEARLLFVDGRPQWERLQTVSGRLTGLKRIISLKFIEQADKPCETRLDHVGDWLFGVSSQFIEQREGQPDDLASIVYTSGTTGRPKGVMLSHRNILSNVQALTDIIQLDERDLLLSFLPLSHMLERTTGYYAPMYMGARVAFARSVSQLADDLQTLEPTVLISVPRIYERFHNRIQAALENGPALRRRLFQWAVKVGWRHFEHVQGRAGWHPLLLFWPLLRRLVAAGLLRRLGGHIRLAVCGGAPLSPEVAQVFIGLGLPLLQGYGLTETSPVISANRLQDNLPASIGLPLREIETRLGEQDELLVRGPNVMLGYWNNPRATAETIDAQGWLHTGDRARVDEQGRLFITGRLKDIIVLANGEKVSPADMELAIGQDRLFEQVMIIGEGRPFLAALVVLNPEQLRALVEVTGCEPEGEDLNADPCLEKAVLARIGRALKDFPGFVRVRRAAMYLQPWNVQDGLLTPTLKLRRAVVMRRLADDIETLYRRPAND